MTTGPGRKGPAMLLSGRGGGIDENGNERNSGDGDERPQQCTRLVATRMWRDLVIGHLAEGSFANVTWPGGRF